MDEDYGTYVDDECVDSHDYDNDSDHDTDDDTDDTDDDINDDTDDDTDDCGRGSRGWRKSIGDPWNSSQEGRKSRSSSWEGRKSRSSSQEGRNFLEFEPGVDLKIDF